MNKKGVSIIITTVLLVLVVFATGAVIYVSSSAFADRMQKENAARVAASECGDKFSYQIYACYKAPNNISLEIVNLKETIPSGSRLALYGGAEDVLMPLPPPFGGIVQGQGTKIEIDTYNSFSLDLTAFGLKKIKVIPVFSYKEASIYCENTQEIEIVPC